MDRLEEHIRKHREELDRYVPPERLWKGVRRQLKGTRSAAREWLRIAAIIVVILGTSVLLFKPEFRWSSRNSKSGQKDEITQYPAQLKETEAYYNNMASDLYSQASPLLVNNPEIKKELNTDLARLDSICTDLKKDLKDNISNQDVVEALIQNYRIKIRILEDLLSAMQGKDSNPEKKKNHEL